MTAREAGSKRCNHSTLKFHDAGLFLMCSCGAVWMAVDSTDPITARPDFGRKGDGDCALRERPVSDMPPRMKVSER